jgi:hypothetical protein
MYYSVFIILYCIHILLNRKRFRNKIIPINEVRGFYFRQGNFLVTSCFYDSLNYNYFVDYEIENTKPVITEFSVSTKKYRNFCKSFDITPKRVEGPFIYETFSNSEKFYGYEPDKLITSNYDILLKNANYDQIVWYIRLTLEYVVIASFYRIGEFLYQKYFF